MADKVTPEMAEAGRVAFLDGPLCMNPAAFQRIYLAMDAHRPAVDEGVVAQAMRRARFERNGRGKAYDPDLPLHETELLDARAAINAIIGER